MEIVSTLDFLGCLAHFLNRRQQQAHQYRNNRHDDEEFHKREPLTPPSEGNHEVSPCKNMCGQRDDPRLCGREFGVINAPRSSGTFYRATHVWEVKVTSWE